MALGINTSSNQADIISIIKYDARAGRFSRVDRQNNGTEWETEQVDITAGFVAVFDLENIEVGWMNFNTGGAPLFHLVKLGENSGQCPSAGFKEGFRIMLKLGKEAGGDVREWCSVAKTTIGALDGLHNAYLDGVKANSGMLPVVAMKSAHPVKTAAPGGKTQTNYAPVFEITKWVPRPADLVWKAKNASASGNGAPAASPAPSGPAATGATLASPPKAASPTTADMDDFG